MEKLLEKYDFLFENKNINDDLEKIKDNPNLYQNAKNDMEQIQSYLISMLKSFSPLDIIAKIGLLRILNAKEMIREKIEIQQFHVDYVTSLALKIGKINSEEINLVNKEELYKIIKLTTLLVMFTTHDLHKNTIKSKVFNEHYQLIRMREFSEEKVKILRDLICHFEKTAKKSSSAKNMLEFVIKLAEQINYNINVLLHKHFDLNYSYQLFIFKFENLKELYNNSISNEEFSFLLDLFTFKSGDFDDIEMSEIILSDRMEEKFLIRLSSNAFFIPNIFSAFDKITDIIEKVISINEENKSKFDKSKGFFLEERILELFSNSFPNSKILKNSQWNKAGIDGENDLTILIENYAIVIEAKSNRVRKNVKKGILKEINKVNENVILKTSEQAEKFSMILKENIGQIIKFKTIGGHVNYFDLTNIKHVIPIGIIFADIPISLMKDLNLNNTIPVPIFSLYELIKIMQCLTLTTEKIDYFRKRYLIECANVRYYGDEYDLLYTYLKCGFNTDMRIYKATKQNEVIMIHYKEEDITREDLERTLLFNNLLIDLEQKKPENWMDTSLEICDIPYAAQKQIEYRMKIDREAKLVDKLEFRKRVVIVNYIEAINDSKIREIEQYVYFLKRYSVCEGLEVSSIFYLGINHKGEYKFSRTYKF